MCLATYTGRPGLTSCCRPTCCVAGVCVSLQVALSGGHKRYAPLDLRNLPNVQPPHIEPGRLEVRLKDFYRKIRRKTEGDEEEEEEDRGKENGGR